MEELTPFINSDIYKFYGSKNNSGRYGHSSGNLKQFWSGDIR